jgi:hypothetical protein
MKKLIVPALLLAAALTGCTPAAPPPASIPSPDTFQTQTLTVALMGVAPEMANSKSIDAARNVCKAILDGKDDAGLVALAKSEFLSNEVSEVSDAQAKLLVAAVRENGFCPIPAP